jgi:ABC-2 type transport system ATP-binding protein
VRASAGPDALAIRTDGLARRFGAVVAVDGVDLRVPRGGVYAFLGPNGAGKTTTIRLLLGLIRPDRGAVRLLGEDLWGRRRAVLGRVGALVETPALYEHLTGRENLRVTQQLVGWPASRADWALATVGLARDADRLVRGYSLGMRQRLGLALALLGEPELLVLDEPTNGLDPAGIHEVRGLVRRFAHELGVTVFLPSHLLAEVEQVATHVGIVGGGRLIYQGTLAALRERYREHTFLRLDDPERAAALLAAHGWPPSLLDAQRGDPPGEPPGDEAPSLRLATADPQERARVVALLVQHGFDVYEAPASRRCSSN